MSRIAVSGYMIRHPVAGNLLAFFHYLLGLHRLGHEVLYVEESGWSGSCYDPLARAFGDDPGRGLSAVRSLMAEHGMDVPAAFVNRDSGATAGMEWAELKSALAASDLLLNIGGVSWLPEFRLPRRRALIDMDPFFTQIGRFAKEGLEEHETCLSYGVNIGRPGCSVPAAGADWLPTLPPVAADYWRRLGEAAMADGAPFTTVANWSAYGSVVHEGERYGQKDEEFLRFIELPRRSRQPLELALSGGEEVRERLRAAGWLVRDGGEVSSTVRSYTSYVSRSRGEFSVAKNAYVKTRCGWFSDRSACYLAAGRPVVLQDTGFTEWLPGGCGVFAYSTLDEAAARLEEASSEDQGAARRRASEAAARIFDCKVVLPRLLDAALHRGPAPLDAVREEVRP